MENRCLIVLEAEAVSPHKPLEKLLFGRKTYDFTLACMIPLQNVIKRDAILQQNVFSFDPWIEF